MMLATLVWGSPLWTSAAVALAAVACAVLTWGYWRAGATERVAMIAAALKIAGIAGLALCLVEPLVSSTRARSGANMFAVVADNSQSLTIHDRGTATSRGENLQSLLKADSSWQERLSTDFDTRRFAIDAQLRSVSDFEALKFDGPSSSLNTALSSIARRFRGLPLAGVMLFTDGNTTDTSSVAWSDLPPVYPVVIGSNDAPPDLAIANVLVSQTNFEAAPIVIRADIDASGFADKKLIASLHDGIGRELEAKTVEAPADKEPLAVRFELKPEKSDVQFFNVKVRPANAGNTPERAEATLANNERQVVVDRGGGPYRVLYVCGRPNWEYKFLRRSLAEDEQLVLVGLVRIARREPKFAFRRHGGESTNPLFSGFEHPDEESAERYDQPVLIRLGTKDENELRAGFPKTADELYSYDAVILDDVEAAFFTQDQQAILKNFVGRRGGGLLMLGGPDSFAAGKYVRSAIGSTLPVYTDAHTTVTAVADQDYHLLLTREGWLQPWVRTRKTEPEERERLQSMSTFHIVNRVGSIKPAATVLAEVQDDAGATLPALVSQRFGRGRSAALLIGDMWRWDLKRVDYKESDLEKSWRQTVRWLVSDVPRRVEVDVSPQSDSQAGAVVIRVRVNDAEYAPLENAQLSIEVTTPDSRRLPLDAESSDDEPGTYQAIQVPRQPGAYLARIVAKAADGSVVGERQVGWVAQPAADEFRNLRPNRAALEEIAAKTGGEVLVFNDIDSFVRQLPQRPAPITEPWIRPAWHHPLFYLAIIACLCGEWGLRRWKGLP